MKPTRLRYQRGITTGWIIGIIVALLAVAAIVASIRGYLDGIDEKGYQRGTEETTAAYAKRDNAALQKANSRIKELEELARAQEAVNQTNTAAIDAKLLKERSTNAKIRETDRVAILNGTLGLRDPGRAAGPADCGGGSSRTTVAAAPGSDGAAGAELSKQFTDFLYSEANRADAVVAQLTSAQALITEQIRACNSP